MVRNILAIGLGWVIGSLVNFGLIMANMAMMPAGTDFSSPEGVNAAMANLQPINFLIVFLAHSLGAMVGGIAAALIATTHKLRYAMFVGILFLVGGIYAAFVISAPVWFEVVDVIFAYIPFAFLGAKLGGAGKEV